MNNKFTEKAEYALNRAVKLAEGLGHTYIGTEHILLSLSEPTGGCAEALIAKTKLTPERIDKAIREISGVGVKSELSSKDTTPRCRSVIEGSYRNSKKYFSEKIGTEHILLALLEERECVAARIFIRCDIDVAGLKDEVIAFLRSSERQNSAAPEQIAESAIPNLLKYGRNMTKIAESGGYDPVIGRDAETERVIRILSRKSKNNPCLIGEAGVGKTAIAEGLATRIAEGRVPLSLRGKTVISVDLTSMVAGAKYRGDFEERIKSIIAEASKNKSVILFIDEIHSIVGAGSAEGAIDASNIMKPELARGEIRVIGATTLEEYRKYIEKDSALERRFQPVMVEEPTPEQTLDILRGIKERYELHHGLLIDDAALVAAVRLSARYITDRFLPDKAIDLVDEACAGKYKEAPIVEENNISGLILGQSAKTLSKAKVNVTEDDIKKTVEEITGIPICTKGALTDGGVYRDLSLAVVGQEQAVRAISSAVNRSLAGINDPQRPKGVFLFLGESGVGKTELAKALSFSIFSGEDALIRLDMSEYGEAYSVSKLIGSAPGYVGYDDTQSVLERVRRHPYSVILLDEIEKAHPDVLSLFLGAFDNGYLSDSGGRRISFRNAYIILTSNIGKDKFKTKTVGFSPFDQKESLYDRLKPYFKEEFINRMDEIVLFSSLDSDALTKIAKRRLQELVARSEERGLRVTFTAEVAEFFGKRAYKSGLGARPLKRAVTDLVESRIAELIVSDSFGENCALQVGIDSDAPIFSLITPSTAAH